MLALDDIFDLEDTHQFEKALDAYEDLYIQRPSLRNLSRLRPSGQPGESGHMICRCLKKKSFLMNRIVLFLTSCLVYISVIGYGQATPIDSTKPTVTDSTQLLKTQERAGKISGQLARNREKLAQLEKDYAEKTADKQKAVEQAEVSAQENRNAAVELSNDAADRGKARRAEKRASRARRDTKSVIRADKNLQRLEKNISKVKKQIEEDEKKLKELQHQQ